MFCLVSRKCSLLLAGGVTVEVCITLSFRFYLFIFNNFFIFCVFSDWENRFFLFVLELFMVGEMKGML